MRLPILGIAIAVLVLGCKESTRTIPLVGQTLEVGQPVQLRIGLPLGFSRDGSKIAVATNFASGVREVLGLSKEDEDLHVSVLDADSMQVLGSVDMPSKATGTLIFNGDGRKLCLATKDGYVAWDYAMGQVEKLAPVGPDADIVDNIWNYDRSIAIVKPIQTIEQRGVQRVQTNVPGRIVLSVAKSFEIPFGARCGFDEYGNAWFGDAGSWTRVDRDGTLSDRIAKSPYLTAGQLMDRGNLHLGKTEVRTSYQGADAYLTCVWISSDRAIPRSKDDFHKAALVYAGPDLYYAAFVPGRNQVCIVSSDGWFMVPYTLGEESP